MSDIFISYARKDQPSVQILAKALEARGWSVWWDRNIRPGKTFDEVIEEAINLAQCVIVVWSSESVTSRWVRTEAAEGVERDILVPVLIENVQIPLAFKRIQAAKLIDWQGNLLDTEFQHLVEAISNILGPPISQRTDETSLSAPFKVNAVKGCRKLKRIYVGNLSYMTSEDDLANLFEQVGQVESVNIITDIDTGRSKGFAFIEMRDEDADRAILLFHGCELNGRTLNVSEARPREGRREPRW